MNISHAVKVNPDVQLRTGRIASIDLFRALTVLVMIMVNEWHGVSGLPDWMKHMPADVDAMSFVDVVFPAFLFIVGMSIPFALQQRIAHGDTYFQLQKHVLQRALGLVVIGVFMVNAEEGFNPAAMLLPISAWALLSYLAAFLLWGSLKGGAAFSLPVRLSGVALLLLLAFIYHGGNDGKSGMTAQWWGILGLIGWAYLIGAFCFQMTRGRLLWLLLCVGICLAYFAAHRNPTISSSPAWSILFSQDGHFSHAAIVLCGCVTAVIFFDEKKSQTLTYRTLTALAFALVLALVATAMRPEYKISKIYATPSWAMYSAASCVLIFALLYYWVDVRGHAWLSNTLAAVAANPLVAYLIPFIVGAGLELTHIVMPEILRNGIAGVMYGLAYALLMIFVVKKITTRGVRLRI